MKTPDTLISQTEAFVKERMSGEGTGHDWWHIYRVRKLAEKIAKTEGGDLVTIRLGALLHDIGDWKFHAEGAGEKTTREWLEKMGAQEQLIQTVCDIVAHVSYKGGTNQEKMKTLEGEIVQDADRLDALGAIGIGRTFAYGGYKGRLMYDPAMPPKQFATLEEFKNTKGTTINHFYEKLLLLKDKMNTKTGKKIAESRHQYLENFLKEFYAEWEGEK